ncbi:MAG: hypothetical protein IJ640_00535 [Prevotella sp.]|nr:hypothetical protein [Prevotella sp.]
MGKGGGTTRSVGSGSASASRTLGGGKGIASGNTFSANATIAQFEGSTSLDGGYYSMMTKDGKFSMVIETENGYNEEYGTDGTIISIGIRKGTGSVTNLTNSFVEAGSTYKESMGFQFMGNDAAVAARINGSMPYYAELANNYIKKNK